MEKKEVVEKARTAILFLHIVIEDLQEAVERLELEDRNTEEEKEEDIKVPSSASVQWSLLWLRNTYKALCGKPWSKESQETSSARKEVIQLREQRKN